MKTLLILLVLVSPLCAARLNSEAHYQKIASEKYDGQTEVSMPDGTRCDIVTETHAIEVDFADKWGCHYDKIKPMVGNPRQLYIH